MAWVGTAESPDGNADVLEIKPPEGPATRLFLDQATHMPLMMTLGRWRPRQFGRRGGGPDGAAPRRAGGAAPPAAAAAGRPRAAGRRAASRSRSKCTSSEYKAVNGIKLPHLITRGVNGQTNEEWEIKSYKINPNFKANTFTK